jgi:hypothetical protein
MNRSLCALAGVLAGACGSERSRTTPRTPDEFSAGEVLVTAQAGGFEAPGSVAAGWHRIRFHQAKGGQGRNLVLFRITDSTDLAAFSTGLDTATQAPTGTAAMGGLESPRTPADTAALLMPLVPGRYVLTSLTRAPNGRRHVSNGMWRELIVTGDSIPRPAPTADVTVRLADHAFVTDDTWPAGNLRVLLVNDGAQDHLLNLMRLETDQSLGAYLDDPGRSERIGGISRMGPGQSVILELSLEPGRYVALCLVRDPGTGRMHMQLGMARLITVVAAAQKVR